MNIEWLEPWAPIERPAERIAFETELQREIGATHKLFGLSVVALARRQDEDDVLFEIDDGRFAEVHLTWRKDREPDARWPHTTIYESASAWIKTRMQPQHDELKSAR